MDIKAILSDPEIKSARPLSCDKTALEKLRFQSKFVHVGNQFRLLRIILETAHGRDRRTTVQPPNGLRQTHSAKIFLNAAPLIFASLLPPAEGASNALSS